MLSTQLFAPLETQSYVIANERTGGLEVQAVDGEDISVVIPVELLAVAAVHSHAPKREHL